MARSQNAFNKQQREKKKERKRKEKQERMKLWEVQDVFH